MLPYNALSYYIIVYIVLFYIVFLLDYIRLY